MNRRRPTRPCATCHHAKTKHRRHECRYIWQTPTVTFRGICLVYEWCRCDGLVDAARADQ